MRNTKCALLILSVHTFKQLLTYHSPTGSPTTNIIKPKKHEWLN